MFNTKLEFSGAQWIVITIFSTKLGSTELSTLFNTKLDSTGLVNYIGTDLSVTTPTEYILNLKHTYYDHYYAGITFLIFAF